MNNNIVKSDKFELVKFNGTELICPIIDGHPYVVMKNIFDDLKMHSKKATGNLKKHPRFHSRVAEWRPVKSIGNLSNKHKYLCLPINKIAGWLYSIQLNMVGKEVREILIVYQDKCDDVLFDFFFGGKKSVVKYNEKVQPVKSDIKNKQKEVDEAERKLKNTPAYIDYYHKKDDLRRLKLRKREIERSFLEPKLF
jgi:hypothetical protein